MRNITGKLMEEIVARKLAQNLERRNALQSIQVGYRASYSGKHSQNWIRCQRKEQTLTVAFDLEDAYNRVQFKLLNGLLVEYAVNLTLTR